MLYLEGNILTDLVSVIFRGQMKHLEKDTIEWVQEQITDPSETLEQAVERLYVEELEEHKLQTLPKHNGLFHLSSNGY